MVLQLLYNLLLYGLMAVGMLILMVIVSVFILRCYLGSKREKTKRNVFKDPNCILITFFHPFWYSFP